MDFCLWLYSDIPPLGLRTESISPQTLLAVFEIGPDLVLRYATIIEFSAGVSVQPDAQIYADLPSTDWETLQR